MKPLFHAAIYLNRRPDDLQKADHGESASDELIEHKNWSTGHKLWMEAKEAGCELPLIFGYEAPLEYWAVARDILPFENSTRYRFAHLNKVTGGYRRRDLVLVSTGKLLSDQFIRSYAIVETPAFLSTAAKGTTRSGL